MPHDRLGDAVQLLLSVARENSFINTLHGIQSGDILVV